MSVNKVNKTTGELVTLANGTRMWIGTKSAHDLAVQQGTMPNNCMVCITDDYYDEDVSDELAEDLVEIVSTQAASNTMTSVRVDQGPTYFLVEYSMIKSGNSTWGIARFHAYSNIQNLIATHGSKFDAGTVEVVWTPDNITGKRRLV